MVGTHHLVSALYMSTHIVTLQTDVQNEITLEKFRHTWAHE